MAAQPTAAQKPSSRWGSFLAGVESRLDTILADEDTLKKTVNAASTGPQEQPAKREGMAISAAQRTSSANRAQDRLNEKLAKAIANRNLAKKDDASVTTSSVPSRTGSPINVASSPRTSSDFARDATGEGQNSVSVEQPNVNGVGDGEETNEKTIESEASGPELSIDSHTVRFDEAQDRSTATRLSTDSQGPDSVSQSVELTRATTPIVPYSPKLNGNITDPSTMLPEQYEKTIEQMRSDHETAELRRQEETHIYLERIDALQSKLQYLTREALEVAKKAFAEADPGSEGQKAAAKDEKIALLIEEGQKLSQTELKHMSIIKKLRAKATENEKSVADTTSALEKHERLAREAQERAKRAEIAEQRATDRIKSLLKVEKDLEAITEDRNAKDCLIQDLQTQLLEATSAAKAAESKANAEALQIERRLIADLRDALSSTKTEKELGEKKHIVDLRELREKFEREKERARIAEMERQAEQNALESRLEAYRARAEEASAGQSGNSQAKLLRQVETLQNQYAVASENWQGIEGSLLSRVTALEKERDDIARREGEIRRKARETNTKARRMEEELGRAEAKIQDVDHELSSRDIQLANLHERLSRSEADALAARNDIKAERETWEAKQNQRIEDEKARIREETARPTPDILYQQFRNDPPIIHTRTRKHSNTDRDRNSPYSRRAQGLAISGSGHSPIERPISRRSSTQPLHTRHTSESPSQRPTSRQDSMSMIPQVSVNSRVPETPSLTGPDDDFFSGVHTPATPERTINDLISVSTAGAGPSVQLVERMSAAVRRLESEKAAHKDELSRLSSQRDESREQVVSLMKEVEEKRAWEKRVKELEASCKEVQERYLTTLEMLGEKSERVEELKADVQDLKGMYRELVENTMK